jgi:hypothetical protein
MYGVMQDMPSVTEADYRLVEQHLGPDRPAGLVAHVAGPTPEGWRVINIWRDEDDFRRFRSERLMRASGLAAQAGLDAAKAAAFRAYTVAGDELPFA